jgi:hypothetical protein
MSLSNPDRSIKRKHPSGLGMQRNQRRRMEGEPLSVTPPASGRPPRFAPDVARGNTSDMRFGHDINDGLDDEAALDRVLRLSVAPGEDGNV